jgi:hypothetical protein
MRTANPHARRLILTVTVLAGTLLVAGGIAFWSAGAGDTGGRAGSDPEDGTVGISAPEASERGLTAAAGDAVIREVRTLASDGGTHIRVEIENIGSVDDEYTVRLRSPDSVLAETTVAVPAGSIARVELESSARREGVALRITVDGGIRGADVDEYDLGTS